MKTLRSLLTTISIFSAMLCLMFSSASAASLTLPASLQNIEEEAFFGNTSIDEVILPEGIKTIGERAFAESSIASIYLPSSLNDIGDLAFQNTSVVGIGLDGTYAQEWFEIHGLVYLVPSTPVEDFEWETINGIEAKITKYIGTDQTVYIPSMIDDYDIVEISSKAFYGNSILESVTIPVSVRSIKNEAFRNCSSLRNVVLNEGLESIGNSVFRNCDSLTSFTFPDSVIEIGSYILADCDQLSGTNYPINAVTVGEGTFSNDPCMTSFHIEEGISIIHGRFFDNNKYLVDLQLPSTLQTIGHHSFYGCTGLTSLNIPSSVVTVESYAFYGCTGFTSIILPNSVTTVNSHAFQKCSALSSVVFSQQLVDIGADAFRECASLLEANLPDTVEGLGEGAFYDCTSLSSFHYPVSLSHRNSQYDNGHLYDGDIFKNCKNLRTIEVPEGVEVIPSGIFKNANYLRSIELPSTLKEIHKSAFENCIAIRTFTIPDGVEEIRACAFSGCTASIIIPDSLEALGERAFAGCILLNSFHYPLSMDHVVSLYDNGKFYEGNIFLNCNKITTITVPEGVTKIPYGFFKGSNYLKSINLPSTITLIDAHSFEDCPAITSLTLPDGLLNVNAAAFAGCTALQSADLPDSVLGLGEKAFDGCTSLQSFHYPMNLQQLNSLYDTAMLYEGNVLRNCEGIKEVIIPEGVTHIPDFMFRGANYLETVILPNSVTSIGSPKGVHVTGQAFRGCTAMEKIYIGPTVTIIGADTFKDCPNLTVWCEFGSTVLQYCKDNSVAYYYLTPDGVNSPSGTLYKGDGYGLYGYARSSTPLIDITATIWDSDKSEIIQTISINPDVTDYDLSGPVNYNIQFSALSLGNYHYTLTAATDLSEETWADTAFTIIPPPLRVSISHFSGPQGIVDTTEGYLNLTGTVYANYPITSLIVTIVDGSGATVLSKSASPNTASFSLSNIVMGNAILSDGSYTLKISVSGNGETRAPVQYVFSVGGTATSTTVSDAMREEIIEYLRNKKVGTFNAGSEVEAYFAKMDIWDIIAMGLSDYSNIANDWISDVLFGAPYNTYMEKQYEQQIARILDELYSTGKNATFDPSASTKKFINKMNSLVKDGTSYYLKDFGPQLQQAINELDSVKDWEILRTVTSINEYCEKINNIFYYVEYGTTFVNAVEELVADHSRDLVVLDIINETYNAASNPDFTAALNTIRNEYNSEFGKSVRVVFDKIEAELKKSAAKAINKVMMDAATGSLYKLATTATNILFNITGLTNAGKTRIEFITQYQTLQSLARSFENVCSTIIIDYSEGKLPTDRQINQMQVTFTSSRQALIRLYDTMINLDDKNANTYASLKARAKALTIPGVASLTGGGGSR